MNLDGKESGGIKQGVKEHNIIIKKTSEQLKDLMCNCVERRKEKQFTESIRIPSYSLVISQNARKRPNGSFQWPGMVHYHLFYAQFIQ